MFCVMILQKVVLKFWILAAVSIKRLYQCKREATNERNSTSESLQNQKINTKHCERDAATAFPTECSGVFSSVPSAFGTESYVG